MQALHFFLEENFNLKKFCELISTKNINIYKRDIKGQTILHILIRSNLKKEYIKEYILEVLFTDIRVCMIPDNNKILPCDIDPYYFKTFMIFGSLEMYQIENEIFRLVNLGRKLNFNEQDYLDFILLNNHGIKYIKFIKRLLKLVPYDYTTFDQTLFTIFKKENYLLEIIILDEKYPKCLELLNNIFSCQSPFSNRSFSPEIDSFSPRSLNKSFSKKNENSSPKNWDKILKN